ncbi:hypothetical protein [Orbus mooreae]|uniref:hypothetical protein n=1 Tax=Orbus mooreae TaxID=3074107 RepID=UPI00370D152C
MIKSIANEIEDFSWLDNPRVSYFAWISLNIGVSYAQTFKSPQLPILEQICSSTDSRANVVKQYFQGWDVYQNDKIDVIRMIKTHWLKVDKMGHPFKKLEENPDNKGLIEWTWNYIQKRIRNDIGVYHAEVSNLIIPTTLNEKYQAIFAIHDYWYTNNKLLHKVFCSEYRQALSQKKYKDKQDIKTLNFQLGIKHKEKLDKLLHHYNYSQQKFFEMLISEHYNSIKDKLDNK